MATAVLSLSNLKEERPIFEVMVLSVPIEHWELISDFYNVDSLSELLNNFQSEAIGADFKLDSNGFVPNSFVETWILEKGISDSLRIFSIRPREIAAESFDVLKSKIDSGKFGDLESVLNVQTLFTENTLLDYWESISTVNDQYTDNQLRFLFSLKNKALGLNYERGINRWTGMQVRNTIKFCVENEVDRVIIFAPLEESFYLRQKFNTSRKIKLIRP